jgi:secreted protein with Ig-like and vWFA domain
LRFKKCEGLIPFSRENALDNQNQPGMFFLAPNGGALAIYRGELSPDVILQDWQSLQNANPTQRYHLAPPLSGTWFTNPLPQTAVEQLFRVKN